MSGLYAFIAGIAAVILAFLSGRASKKKEADTQKKKAEIAADVAKTVSDNASVRASVQADSEAVYRQIETARQNNDTDAMGRIAQQQADIALQRINR